eukprot:5554852-Pyramimonas_sp.AAC.2
MAGHIWHIWYILLHVGLAHLQQAEVAGEQQHLLHEPLHRGHVRRAALLGVPVVRAVAQQEGQNVPRRDPLTTRSYSGGLAACRYWHRRTRKIGGGNINGELARQNADPPHTVAFTYYRLASGNTGKTSKRPANQSGGYTQRSCDSAQTFICLQQPRNKVPCGKSSTAPPRTRVHKTKVVRLTVWIRRQACEYPGDWTSPALAPGPTSRRMAFRVPGPMSGWMAFRVPGPMSGRMGRRAPLRGPEARLLVPPARW